MSHDTTRISWVKIDKKKIRLEFDQFEIDTKNTDQF